MASTADADLTAAVAAAVRLAPALVPAEPRATTSETEAEDEEEGRAAPDTAVTGTTAAAALRSGTALLGVVVVALPEPASPQVLRLLVITRDVVQAGLAQPEIFVVLDAAVARLPEAALLDSLTDTERGEVDAVATLVERVRRTSAIDDRWAAGGGRRSLDAKLARFVRSRLPVRLVLPAFPMKSPDAVGKVLGDQPDAGELLALLTLDALARDVAAVYAPGCHVLVVSDGRVFNDIYVVPDDAVSRYGRTLRRLAPAGHLQFIGLDELFASMGNADKRAAVVAFGARGTEQVAAKLAVDAHFREIYLAFKKLLTRDCGLNQYRASAAAKVMMQRNECYSDLIRLLFPHHIRLSIHDHSGLEKIGIHLVGRSIITPWHGVAVRHRDGRWAIVRRQDAEKAGHVRRDLADEEADSEGDGADERADLEGDGLDEKADSEGKRADAEGDRADEKDDRADEKDDRAGLTSPTTTPRPTPPQTPRPQHSAGADDSASGTTPKETPSTSGTQTPAEADAQDVSEAGWYDGDAMTQRMRILARAAGLGSVLYYTEA